MFARPKKTNRDPLDESLHGFPGFLIFCLEFFEVLERTNELPLLQSGFWHYHPHWFEYLRKKLGRDWENAMRSLGRGQSTLEWNRFLKGVKTRCGTCVMSPFALVQENMASR
jgi:hypothetical protein